MKRAVKVHAGWANLSCLVVLAIASCLSSREGGGSYLKAESDSGRVGLPATPADEKAPLTATVVDTAGVTTEITDPSTDLSFGFGGLYYGSVGLAVEVKVFTPTGSHESEAKYTRWLFFDQIESLTLGKAQTVTARLRTGATLSGKYGYNYNERNFQCHLLGKSSDGQFDLALEKVKSVTFRGTGEKPDVPVKGEPAIVTLRSGEVLRAEDVCRHTVIQMAYIDGTHYNNYRDTSVWIKYKRGEGTVKKEIPFKQIKEIAFEGQAPPGSHFYSVPLCKLSLVDGSTLSGACEGDDSQEAFEFLVGRTDLGPFEVFGNMSAAIQSIAFSR